MKSSQPFQFFKVLVTFETILQGSWQLFLVAVSEKAPRNVTSCCDGWLDWSEGDTLEVCLDQAKTMKIQDFLLFNNMGIYS